MAEQSDQQVFPYIDPHNMEFLATAVKVLNGKQIHEYSFQEQYEMVGSLQTPRPTNPGIDISEHLLDTSHGQVKTFLFKPGAAKQDIPFVYFVHGGGWVFGSAHDWEAFIFDLIMRTGVAVVFPEYTLAPEKKFPTQQEQCLEVLQSTFEHGHHHGLKTDEVVLAGDSVGCQIIAAISILHQQRTLRFKVSHQIFLHPFVNMTARLLPAPLNSIEWRDQYFAAYFNNQSADYDITASPGSMTEEEAKKYMPPTTIITSDCDALRDMGEDFAKLLQGAGVPCGVLRAIGSLHDFEIFHQARDSPTSNLVMGMIAALVKNVLSTAK